MKKKRAIICLSVVFVMLGALLLVAFIIKISPVTDFKQYGKWDNREIQGTLKIFPDSLEGLGAEK